MEPEKLRAHKIDSSQPQADKVQEHRTATTLKKQNKYFEVFIAMKIDSPTRRRSSVNLRHTIAAINTICKKGGIGTEAFS